MARSDDLSRPTEIPPDAILLAAGRGTRIGKDRPKVLLEVAGRPMLAWIVDACHEAGVGRCVVVVGPDQRESVAAAVDTTMPCHFVVQKERLGTAHAAQAAAPICQGHRGDVFVLAGDGPLIRAPTLNALHREHADRGAAATLATAVLERPEGYGRVLRNPDGSFDRIVEEKDATAAQRAVHEVNPSYYCFRSSALFAALPLIEPRNRQAEYYLTDVPALLKRQGHAIGLVDAVDAEEAMSINTPEQMREVDAILRQRLGTASQTDASR